MKKKVLFAAAFMLATVGAYAQGNGIAGMVRQSVVADEETSLRLYTRRI